MPGTAKKTTSRPEKTKTTHPRTGSRMAIDTAVYDAFSAAILQSLKGSKGKTFTELTEEVTTIIRKKMPAFKGSVPWYTISIRLDLETKGMVEAFVEKRKKLNRLKKK